MPTLTLETLHGPPRLGGVLFPNAQFESPVEGVAVDESRYKQMATGTIKKVGPERYRLKWELGWKVLSDADSETLLSIIEQKEGFTFTPRTIKAGIDDDPSAVESIYTVRCVSDINLTKMLIHSDYEMYLELETVDIITEPE